MRLSRWVAALAATILLAGCVGARLIEPGPTKAIGNAYTVTVTRQWSDITYLLDPRPPNVRLLSIDGPFLNRLYLASLTEGQSLVRHEDRDTPRPTYSGDMSDAELVELIIDCIATEYQNPRAEALRPQSFSGGPGVRFDVSAATARGLNISGTVLVARHGDRLNVMLYLAPSEHYYGALLPEVETIFASAAAR